MYVTSEIEDRNCVEGPVGDSVGGECGSVEGHCGKVTVGVTLGECDCGSVTVGV